MSSTRNYGRNAITKQARAGIEQRRLASARAKNFTAGEKINNGMQTGTFRRILDSGLLEVTVGASTQTWNPDVAHRGVANP